LMPELKDQVEQLSHRDNEVHSVDFLTNLLSRDRKAFIGRNFCQHFHDAIPEGVYQGKILSHQSFGEEAEKIASSMLCSRQLHRIWSIWQSMTMEMLRSMWLTVSMERSWWNIRSSLDIYMWMILISICGTSTDEYRLRGPRLRCVTRFDRTVLSVCFSTLVVYKKVLILTIIMIVNDANYN
jgi:hypothetical protein